MTMTQQDAAAHSVGATWPDVAMEVVKFAREEPLVFILVFVTVVLGLWFLFPRVTAVVRARYQKALDKLRNNAGDKETPDD
ncbi:MAG: hypothetical protein OXQ90_20235 [Gammaproteobacteria bacterium]|nr:hypothetical protein [Gammaproteobacteria bacterium]